MLLLFFFFGVIGFYTFSANDPFHFGTLPLAMITLLRQSVYENSGDIWYINTFGCDVYNDGIYVTNATLTNFPALYLCTPQASYILAPIYFLSFLIIVAFVVMSLFIGAISLSMSKALDAIDHSQREKARKKVCIVCICVVYVCVFMCISNTVYICMCSVVYVYTCTLHTFDCLLCDGTYVCTYSIILTHTSIRVLLYTIIYTHTAPFPYSTSTSTLPLFIPPTFPTPRYSIVT